MTVLGGASLMGFFFATRVGLSGGFHRRSHRNRYWLGLGNMRLCRGSGGDFSAPVGVGSRVVSSCRFSGSISIAIGVLPMTTISSVPETNASGLYAASACPPVTGALPGPRSAELLAHLACRESNARISAAPAHRVRGGRGLLWTRLPPGLLGNASRALSIAVSTACGRPADRPIENDRGPAGDLTQLRIPDEIPRAARAPGRRGSCHPPAVTDLPADDLLRSH